ncbi:hypothetical protein WN944_027555 [Citrus x changshan-huyou]|uniref:Uncharacterized protein n=1 Tax=Citrus x changshan-huyou TaxID=2935761 RepID=A0AAP0Q9A5_9ROSI
MTAIMASRIAVRNFSRRFSSSGKVLSEEEKAAENVYIKVMFLQLLICTCKVEQEKLEKMARKGPKPEETPAASSGSGAEAKPTSAAGASTEKVSTDQYRNYAVIAGIITGVSALGWYLKSSRKKEQVQD